MCSEESPPQPAASPKAVSHPSPTRSMRMRATREPAALAVVLAALLGMASAQTGGGKKEKFPGTYTSTEDPKLPVDFKYQGEYIGEVQGGDKLGAQVIAL